VGFAGDYPKSIFITPAGHRLKVSQYRQHMSC
jgi:hypothetical protein